MALSSIVVTPTPAPQPKQSSSASHSSFAASNSSDESQTSQQSASSSSSSTNDNGNATHNSGKNSSSGNGSSGGQAQSSSSSSQSQQSSSASQAQAASAANGKNGAQAAKTPGASFMQALAQSQADAADSVTATASADPQAVTAGKGKAKSAKDSGSDSSTSLTFMPQSLVAAMAGVQQQSTVQGAADGDDSVDGVSLSSGTSAQTLATNLLQASAAELKEADADATQLDADSGTAATTATASAAGAFQSHLGVSSQIQSNATQDPANTQVNSSIGSSGFADEVGEKITWMAHQGVQSASLQMTPEHMGPVEVKISMQDGSASVSINAANADTRAALEQALPRLREMFSSQGLNLADANVSQQFTRGQQQKQNSSTVGSVSNVSDESASTVVSVTSARLGLLDTYA